MNLREQMERRASGLPPPCFVANHGEHPPCLRLEFGNGNLLLIPWVRFLYAVLESGVLTLTFQHHEITVEGKNLGNIADAIGSEELSLIREMPSCYSMLADGRPFVSSLTADRRAVK